MPPLTTLDEQECWARLRTATVGRIALIQGGIPSVLPVNVCVGDDAVWFRAGPGALLDAALAGEVLCVEADDIDVEVQRGWSVVVTGRAEVAADRPELPLQAWGRPDADHLVRVPAELVTGRRLDTSTPVVAGA